MWDLIANLVESYAGDGDPAKAMDALSQALTTEPMWIPQALFDPRTKAVRERPDFQAATALPNDDGPAHFNAAAVALEHGAVDSAVVYLGRAFNIAAEDGSLPFLIEAIENDPSFKPHLAHAKLSGLIARHKA